MPGTVIQGVFTCGGQPGRILNRLCQTLTHKDRLHLNSQDSMSVPCDGNGAGQLEPVMFQVGFALHL